MSDSTEKAIPFNVRLQSSEPPAHPVIAEYRNVGIAQGMVCFAFG